MFLMIIITVCYLAYTTFRRPMPSPETHIPARRTTDPAAGAPPLAAPSSPPSPAFPGTVCALVYPAFLHFAPIFLQGYVKTCYK